MASTDAPSFVHLHLHTAYSLSEGAIRVKDLAKACKAAGMPAVAMTDSNTLAGAAVFTKEMAKAGVQPIIGAQMLLAHRTSAAEDTTIKSKIVLLAMNREGYDNLVRLVSEAYMATDDGVDPAVTIHQLKDMSAGLIFLTGGSEGPIDTTLREGEEVFARQQLAYLKKIFGDRVYLELHRHSGRFGRVDFQEDIEPKLIELADALEIPLVAGNDCYFLEQRDYEAHDALLCVANKTYISQTERRRVSAEHYVKSPEKMAKAFADLPDAIANTVVIAQRCAYAFEKEEPMLPPFPGLDGKTEEQHMRDLAAEGLEKKFEILKTPEDKKPEYRKRLDFELDVIANMGFPGYFLIVADFIGWAKSNDISVGPGRGSGAGSLVAYALGITDLDPLTYGLLFERFLNPDRVSMPDFDIDFCQERRDEVIDYVRQRYGAERVAQIGTFGSYKPRAAVKAAGRVLQVPYGVMDRFSKMVPNNPNAPMSLTEAMETEPLKSELERAESDVQRMFRIALGLENLFSHGSTHAAGVVIADRPVGEIVPLMKDKDGKVATNYDMKAVEDAGLVKFDFLGLKTLDVIDGARAMIAETGTEIDFDKLGVADKTTYRMLADADSFGVFQLESEGMRAAMRQIQPSSIDDLVALVSLYRPGPMENIPVYAQVKAGERDADYMHPVLEPILKETYGILVYQEQVMELARRLAGYSLGEADLLRRAMGKKIKAEMDAQIEIFEKGAVANGIDAEKAKEIFAKVEKFASYGFNKSHAAAYAVIAYRTAYLKAHYPYEFYAAAMNLDLHQAEKLAEFSRELNREGLKVVKPDVNRCFGRFTVCRSGKSPAILYALAAIRGVGDAAMVQLEAERKANGPFKSMTDFVNRTTTFCNKKVYEGLIHAGACDTFGFTRAALLAALPKLVKVAQTEAKEAASDQGSLFGDMLAPSSEDRFEDGQEMGRLELLQAEYNALGIFLSGHPLDGAARMLADARARQFAEVLGPTFSGDEVKVGALVMKIQVKQTRKGTNMGILMLSDPSGQQEAVAFPDDYDRIRERLQTGEAYVFVLGVSEREGMKQLIVRNIEPLVTDLDFGSEEVAA